jgi:mRNA-degrading endonuclease RelE of RelBE toxin-antitoxin system
MRTTIDIDDPVLNDLKKLGKAERKSLGRLVSDLLAQALQERKAPRKKPKPSGWVSKEMGVRVDLNDKEALYAALERRTPAVLPSCVNTA